MPEILLPPWFRAKLVEVMGELEADRWLQDRGARIVEDYPEAASTEPLQWTTVEDLQD